MHDNDRVGTHTSRKASAVVAMGNGFILWNSPGIDNSQNDKNAVWKKPKNWVKEGRGGAEIFFKETEHKNGSVLSVIQA